MRRWTLHSGTPRLVGVVLSLVLLLGGLSAQAAELLVSSIFTNQVLRYDGATGAPLSAFVAAGSGGLDFPEGLVFGPDGALYVSSIFTAQVLRYDGATGAPLGAFVAAGSGGLALPVGLVFGPDGALYVSSIFTAQVLRYDGATGASLGAFVAAGSGGLNGPIFLTFGPSPAAECPEDADKVLTRAVDPEGDDAGLLGGLPTHLTLQAAVDAAVTGEVIGVYGRSTENVDISGDKRLTITQCTVAQLTAAAAGPVVDITSTGTITIIGLDTVGGTIGWRVGTDGHDLKGVRATGASQFGILVVGHDNHVSYNAVRSSAVGIRVEGSGNDLRGGTVEHHLGDGVQVGLSATDNTFRTATVQRNGGHGIVVAGSHNTIRDNSRVNRNTLNGLLVTGSDNSLRSNRADENTQDGFHISGHGTTLQDNKANKNGGDGFDISGTGNLLKGNASNQGSSGGSNENAGAEYRVSTAAINQGGNKADSIGVPKTTAPVKCPTFPAAGLCE